MTDSSVSKGQTLPDAPVTRFAPSPSGMLHVGHAYAAHMAWRAAATAEGGRFLLRLEDIDRDRCRPEFETAILEDLHWLGLAPAAPPWRQSDRFPVYRQALERLRDAGLVYPCFCTRAQIRAEIAASAQAPHGPEGAIYPGTCRSLEPAEAAARIAAGAAHAWRLDSAAAAARVGRLAWHDLDAGTATADAGLLGDVVLARKEVPTSYHLAVVIDDAAQGITLVTRGEDLRYACHLHRVLQALLDLPVPVWRHHPILLRHDGKRLAKRDRDLTIRELRDRGMSPAALLDLADRWAAEGPPSGEIGTSASGIHEH
ncbi:tRNA glutamyl-Q(34) synthetase GluQRS [Marinibaculum pumilum]|uniref:tRNA glutamyl-Q(34) synthetase GluQRS n=1 Tax=Marinibaculum pumilum TaxID=1766165 RepID=A0ABV7L9T1_9PROT